MYLKRDLFLPMQKIKYDATCPQIYEKRRIYLKRDLHV